MLSLGSSLALRSNGFVRLHITTSRVSMEVGAGSSGGWLQWLMHCLFVAGGILGQGSGSGLTGASLVLVLQAAQVLALWEEACPPLEGHNSPP